LTEQAGKDIRARSERCLRKKKCVTLTLTCWKYHCKSEKTDITKISRRRNGNFTFWNIFRNVKDGLHGILALFLEHYTMKENSNPLSSLERTIHIPKVRTLCQRQRLCITIRSWLCS
jgi:hypothetical protein